MPLTTDQLIAQSKAMLAQTAAEGTKAFAGSSYDNASSLIPKEDLQSFKQANPNLNFQYGDLGQYNAAGSTPTITASAMQPKTAYNFQTPQTTLIPSVSAPTKTAEDIINEMYGTPTQNEGQISDIQRSIAELTGQQAQETSRRAQLEGTPEMEAKRQQVRTLVARANALSAEAQAIPLQMQQQIQEGGANVTKGGIAPIQTAALRNNAIQALSTGALLSAAQGDLTSALDQVDRAVAAEFEPIKAQLAAKRANLEMLMNDPASTREEKRRAALAEVQLKQIETEQATKEENRKAILDIATKASSMGADGLALKAITSAQSQEEALAIAAQLGLIDTAALDKKSQVQFEQNLAIAKFNEDKRQFGLEYALNQQKFVEEKKQKEFERLSTKGNTSEATGKPLTEGERVALGYANRLTEANKVINDIGANFTSALSYFGQIMPNVLKLSDRQKYEQAQRNFINSVLRKESGAVISEEEFANAKQQYFPQPGDGVEVVMQKSNNRNTVIESMYRAGGKSTPSGGLVSSTGFLRSPDGKQEVNISELTPQELQEAKDAGWK